jgi:hypothetical protein
MEIAGIILAVVGIAFAFEVPRHWFLRVSGLSRLRADSDATGVHVTDETLSPITVKEIVDTINREPPFQREELGRKYSGITVEWIGYLREIHEEFHDKRRIRVNLYVDPKRPSAYSFWFTREVAKFPEVRTLTTDSEVRVKGKILRASGTGMCVHLEPREIEVLRRAT